MSAPLLRFVVATVFALAVGSCDSGPTGPVAGDVEFTIVSPHGPEGAALIQLQTADIGSVTSVEARVFTHSTGDNTKVLLVRTTPGTLTFRLAVNDMKNPPAVSLLQVASGDDQLRDSLSAYRVESETVTLP